MMPEQLLTRPLRPYLLTARQQPINLLKGISEFPLILSACCLIHPPSLGSHRDRPWPPRIA